MNSHVEDLSKLKVIELKEELKKINQPIYGAVLIERLRNYRDNLASQSITNESSHADSYNASVISSNNDQAFTYSLRLEQANISDVEDSVQEDCCKKKSKKPSKLQVDKI